MSKARRQARRARRKERRKNRRERRSRRKEMRMERKEKRLEGGSFFERLGQSVGGVVEKISNVRDMNEQAGDPFSLDRGYQVVPDQAGQETQGINMEEAIKKYWWVGLILAALFFFQRR